MEPAPQVDSAGRKGGAAVTEVRGPSDLAVGDEVTVREYSRTGTGEARRGVVVKVGKSSATVRFVKDGVSKPVGYGKTVVIRDGWRGVRKWTHYQISKLSAHDLWMEQEPKGDVAWTGRVGETIVVSASAVRDSVESAIAAIRAYHAWLLSEPKEES